LPSLSACGLALDAHWTRPSFFTTGNTRKEVVRMNGERWRDYSYWLSSIDVSQGNQSGQRIVATGWIISNCTSNWNGSIAKIDLMKHGELKEISKYEPWAANSEGIKASVHGNVVNFRYMLRNYDVGVWTAGPGVASYEVLGEVAVRRAPLALTKGTFITEWLNLSSRDVAAFSSPEAAKQHSGIEVLVRNRGLEWRSAASCESTPHLWKLTADIYDAHAARTFVIEGSTVNNLRMRSVETVADYRGCRVIDPKQIPAVLTQPLAH
jgi:hypothetical protein